MSNKKTSDSADRSQIKEIAAYVWMKQKKESKVKRRTIRTYTETKQSIGEKTDVLFYRNCIRCLFLSIPFLISAWFSYFFVFVIVLFVWN